MSLFFEIISNTPDVSSINFIILCVVSFFTSAISASFGLGGGTMLVAVFVNILNPLAVIPIHAVIQLNSNFAHAHRTLSRILKYDDKEKHLDELEASYNRADKDSPGKMDLAFALGKAYEDLKKFDKSFNFYEEANLLRRKNINFSMQNEKETFQEITNYFTKNLFPLL